MIDLMDGFSDLSHVVVEACESGDMAFFPMVRVQSLHSSARALFVVAFVQGLVFHSVQVAPSPLGWSHAPEHLFQD